MSMINLTLGLAGAVHPNMPGDDTGLYRSVTQSMRQLAKKIGFDLKVFADPLRSEEDGRNACEYMNRNAADFTIIFNASLPFGRVILPFAKLKGRLGLWSAPEPATEGILQLNSFCGTNMLGSIIGNYLNRYDLLYKWFYGMPDEPGFIERLGITVRALKAIKGLENANIAQVGGLANGFENMYIDERVPSHKFGYRIQTRHTVEEVVAGADSLDKSAVDAEVQRMIAESSGVNPAMARVQMEKAARIYLSFEELVKANGYTALGISCWPRFQERYDIAVCSVLSRLNARGIVAACEGDIPAVTNMIMFNAMSGSRASLNDLVAFDRKDNSLNLWHCGVAPANWADEEGITWDRHFNIGCYAGDIWNGVGVVAAMKFRPGRITVSTMDNSFDKLFILTGDIMREKRGYQGSSGWVNNLAINGTPVALEDLMNTILVENVNHHYPAAYGDFVNELNEFAEWKKMKVIEPRAYKPYIQRAVISV